MKKDKKYLVSEEYISIFNNNPLIFVFHYNHLTLNDITLEKKKQELSLFLEDSYKKENLIGLPEMNFKVIKNKLMKSSLKKSQYRNMVPLFSGPTLLLYISKVTPFICKQIFEWKKKDVTFTFLGGKYDNDLISYSDFMEITQLSNNHVNEVAKQISFLNSPVLQLIQVLSSNQYSMVNTLETISNKSE